MKIKIKNTSQHPSPKYSTLDSAGIDLRANLTNQILLKPLERVLIKQDYLLNYQEVMKHKLDLEVVLHIKKV